MARKHSEDAPVIDVAFAAEGSGQQERYGSNKVHRQCVILSGARRSAKRRDTCRSEESCYALSIIPDRMAMHDAAHIVTVPYPPI